jgi:hypothetical protein
MSAAPRTDIQLAKHHRDMLAIAAKHVTAARRIIDMVERERAERERMCSLLMSATPHPSPRS